MLVKCFAPEVHPSLLWDGKHSFVFICEASGSVLVSHVLWAPVSSRYIG